MKKLLAIIVLSLCFTIPSQADDIRDFQIEGMSVGDSLLNYFSKEEIEKRHKITKSRYTSKKLLRTYFKLKKFEIYPTLNIHYKNNEKFTIESVAGFFKYDRNNIKDCYSQQKEVNKEIKNIFPNLNQVGTIDKKHKMKRAKGTYTRVSFNMPSGGSIKSECRKWGRSVKYASGLNVILSSQTYLDWLNNEAYK